MRNQYAIILDIVIVVYKEQGQNEILIKRKLGLFLSLMLFPNGILLNVHADT